MSKEKKLTMLYKHPGEEIIDGTGYSYIIVDQAEVDKHLKKEGWYTTVPEALKNSTAPPEKKKESLAEKLKSLDEKLDKFDKAYAEFNVAKTKLAKDQLDLAAAKTKLAKDQLDLDGKSTTKPKGK